MESESAVLANKPTEIEQDTEISEVDSGNKESINYDELISFSHTFTNYSICECFETEQELNEKTFGFLLSNEFILGGSVLFDLKQTMSNTELIDNIKMKVRCFKGAELGQKISLIENLMYYAKEIGMATTVDLLFPILLKIYEEKPIVIERFLSVLPEFAEFLNSFGEKGYILIKDHMIPVLNEIFKVVEDQKIIDACAKDLVILTKYLNNDDKGAEVLTKVIFMAHEDTKENIRVLSVKLFNDLAQVIGGELYEIYVVPQMASFADDQSSKVRKAVASNLISICECVSHEVFVGRLLSVYQKISKDSLWNVRKAAVEILPKLTKLCDSATISGQLFDIFKTFATDQKNHVRISALEVFGEFISLIKKDEDKDNYQVLLDFYINSIQDFKGYKGENDIKIISKCAYNFPAVLLFWGKENWERLKPCYVKMMEERDEKIKI
ncbi:MAG: hypothetical protein MJ252_30910, partial [archaeon]|nr:hypothetical protein [archaeon]